MHSHSLSTIVSQAFTLVITVWVMDSASRAFAQEFDLRLRGTVGGRQQIKANLAPEAASAKAIGRVPPSTPIRFSVGLVIPKNAELQAFLTDVYNPASPNYRKFLTSESFTAQYAPSAADYRKVLDWANSRHLSVERTYPNRMLVDVSGTAADVERAVHVSLEQALRADKSTFYRPDRNPSIDLAVPIGAINGLDNFVRPRHFGGSSPSGTYISRDLRAAYASGSQLTGRGQSIGIVAFDGYDPTDVAAYRTDAGLAALAPVNVLFGGATGNPAGMSAETVSDIELAMAMAPGASVTVYIGTSCSDYDSMLNSITTSMPLSLQNSSSFGICWGPHTLTLIDVLASQGQSFFMASGDTGACPPNSQQVDRAKVTVVGGTTLTMNGTGLSYQSEVTWNDPKKMLSSGGCVEDAIPIPSWQAGTTFTSGSGASTTNRNNPDVAMVATGVYIRSSHPLANGFYGTSAAAPLWAGYMALVNERWQLAGMTAPVGWASPAIWNIGRTPAAYSIAFNDITSGVAQTYPPNPSPPYSAGPGYDLTTGWGTPKPALIDQLACVQQGLSGHVRSMPPNCEVSIGTSLGDTHLTTFNGLFYDFQAAGDFTLAEVASGFEVQTRQVSGAPTWPNATVNKAVAARFGKTQVAICSASPGTDETTRVIVDGKLTPMEDGKTLLLPEGGDIRRGGDVYLLVGKDGDSVRAGVNSYNGTTWIDVSVGLGRWPSAAKGLIANVNGNINQIATRDNIVLTNPFDFDELYHRFADSWRVGDRESMLSVCNAETPIERGIPKVPFYAKDLAPNVREKALTVCNAAGVKPGALLDACTLDVAVIGQDAAAKVFVGATAPTAVGTVVATPSSSLARLLLWLSLLLAIVIIVWLLYRTAKATP
jgi:hypothetical protein